MCVSEPSDFCSVALEGSNNLDLLPFTLISCEGWLLVGLSTLIAAQP